jgi:hypothetical protein
MILIKTSNPRRRNFTSYAKSKIVKELIPPQVPPTQKGMPDVDMSQLGSGMSGIKQKLQKLEINSNNAKQKYDKFINLKL